MQDLPHVPPRDLVRVVVAEEPRVGPVGAHDVAVAHRQHQPHAGVLEDGAEAILALAQRFPRVDLRRQVLDHRDETAQLPAGSAHRSEERLDGSGDPAAGGGEREDHE